MTKNNEEMIIDDVDVSGCSEIRLKQDGLHTCWEYKELDGISICKDKPNCLYKQLKRKERECEKLRFPMKDNNYAILTKEEFENFNQLKKENEQLKQTLIEIKEICKTNVCKHCYSKFKVDDNYCKSRKDCDCYNILQKINEAEDEKI